MKKIKTILIKEWMEVFKNKMVIFTVAFLPLMMVAIPLGDALQYAWLCQCTHQPGKLPVSCLKNITNKCALPVLPGQNVSRCTWSASS